MRPHELCRRCGSRLDAVHIAADDLALQRALRVVSDVFPRARRIREEQP